MSSQAEIWHSVYLALGSNLGDRTAHLRYAVRELSEISGMRVLKTSPVYKTAPEGGVASQDFYNACAMIETKLAPTQLLGTLLAIESAAGRVRKKPLDDRILDIDILFFDNLIVDDAGLVLPHPRFEKRLFVLQPLHDIAPEFIDPKSGLKIRELLGACDDRGAIERMPYGIDPDRMRA